MRDSIQTKLQIVSSLEDLIQTQSSFESIRVIEVCKKCNISRSVFYYHFKDVYDIVTWMWDYIMNDSLYQVGKTLSWHEAHFFSFLMMLRHRKLFMIYFQGNEPYSVVEHGYRTMIQIISERVTSIRGKGLSEFEMFELEYFVRAASSMTKKWAMEGMMIKPEWMANLYDHFIPDFLKITLNQNIEKSRSGN